MRSIGLTYDLSTRLLSFTTPPTGREVIVGTRGDNLGTCLTFTFANAGTMLNTDIPFCAIGVPIVTESKEVTSYEEEITKTVAEGVTTWHPIYIPDEVMSSALRGKMAIQIHMRHNPANSDDFAYEYFSLNMLTMEVVPSIPNPIPIQPVLPGESYYVLRTEFVTKMAQLDAKDLELQTNITNEATARSDADDDLDDRIDQEISDREDAISDEVTARNNAISAHNQSDSAHADIREQISTETNARIAADSGKVDKVTGKGLSTNDLTDELKGQYDSAYEDKHTHDNKDLLDTYDQTNANISDAVTKRHAHSNIDILNATQEAFTTALKTSYDNAVDDEHTHGNKTLLDTYNQSNADIADAVTKRHAHGNMGVLNSIIGVMANNANDKLTNQSFVNSSIATETATFRGTYNAVNDLHLTVSATHSEVAAALNGQYGPQIKTNNDYVYVEFSAYSTTPGRYDRYKYSSGNSSWAYEYSLNNSSFTQAQWDAINSTITSEKVSSYNTHIARIDNPHSVTKAQVGLGNVVNTGDSATPVENGTDKFTTGGAFTELAKKVDKVSGKGLSTNDYTTSEKTKLAGIADGAEVNVQSDWNETDTTSDAYIQNKPTIPTIPDISVVDGGTTGNVITNVTASGHTITITKGTVQTSVSWGDIGGTLADQDDLQDALDAKQDDLISGTNIKTVNSNSLLGSGDVSITAESLGFTFTEVS